MQKGKVKWFDNRKGYGFIEKADGSGDVFVHFSGIKNERFKTLTENDEVEFEEIPGRDGRMQAINVVIVAK
jgi:CspA family cold shock protein